MPQLDESGLGQTACQYRPSLSISKQNRLTPREIVGLSLLDVFVLAIALSGIGPVRCPGDVRLLRCNPGQSVRAS
jgi:hypothetical protein